MAPASPKGSTKCHVRSISLPSRSHPTTLKIVQELNRVSSCATASASGSIRASLLGLEELYEVANEFLALTSTQQAISSNKRETCVDELLDGSVGLLDAFSTTRELASQIKEHAYCIQSMIRRRNPDPSNVKKVVSEYACFQKKMRKDVKQVVAGLKRIEDKFEAVVSPAVDGDRHFYSVMMVLREVNALSASILRALLSKIEGQASCKKSKWCVLSKLVHKGTIAHEDEKKQENGNEFEALDAAVLCLSNHLSSENDDNRKVEITQDQLMGIESVEDDLDGLYRRLIRMRAFLLNIFSQ